MYRSLNPATGELLEEFPHHTDAESEAALDLAAVLFHALAHETDVGVIVAIHTSARENLEKGDQLGQQST